MEEWVEDGRTQYVHIDDDIVPDAATARKLRAFATHWWGVSAVLSSWPSPSPQHAPLVFPSPPPTYPTALHPAASNVRAPAVLRAARRRTDAQGAGGRARWVRSGCFL
ncbi:hypothetical protein B0H10DRAFT_2126077, partial [Mycena sp. CBHHK59/15]